MSDLGFPLLLLVAIELDDHSRRLGTLQHPPDDPDDDPRQADDRMLCAADVAGEIARERDRYAIGADVADDAIPRGNSGIGKWLR